MEGQKERTELISRRSMLKGSAAFLVGGAVGCSSNKPAAGSPPPLPWPWAKLDPMEAGRRAYQNYLKEPGG